MRVNISALETYLECPRKWYYTYILGKGVPHSGDCHCGMCDGTRWHQLVSGEKTLDEIPSPPRWMSDGLKAWEAWQAKRPEISFLAHELVLEAPLGQHTIFGRLDALVEWNNQLWHLQHKSLRGSVPWDVYTRVVRRSFHEHAYQHLITSALAGTSPARQTVQLPANIHDYHYAGTILVVCRKVNTAFPILTEFLSVSNHDDALEDLKELIEQVEEAYGNGRLIQNRKSCAGMFQNKLCPFIDVCERQRSIDSMPDLDPLEAYK